LIIDINKETQKLNTVNKRETEEGRRWQREKGL